MKKTHLSLLVATTLLPLSVFAVPNTATVLSVKPAVTSTYKGQTAVLAIKNQIPLSSIVKSDKQGRAQLTFPDNSTISITPNTEIALEDFVDDDKSQNIVLNLAVGTARVVTGEVSRRNPNAFTVKTPHATVGIRGTIVTISVEGDTTKVYLTQTSGAGVRVTVLSTKQQIALTTPGNVLIIGPEGVNERPIEQTEARDIRVGLRGEDPKGMDLVDRPEVVGFNEGELDTTPEGPNSLMGNDPLAADQSQGYAQRSGLNVNQINGTFIGGGRTTDNLTWDTNFSVNGDAQISGASLTIHNIPAPQGGITPTLSGGAGTIEADGSFNINNLRSDMTSGGGGPNSGPMSAEMTGQFISPTAGAVSFTAQETGSNYSTSGSGTFRQ